MGIFIHYDPLRSIDNDLILEMATNRYITLMSWSLKLDKGVSRFVFNRLTFRTIDAL